MAERIFSGDTAVITSALLDEDQISIVPVVSVEFTALGPDDQDLLVSALPSNPVEGQRVGLLQAVSTFNPYDILEFDGTT